MLKDNPDRFQLYCKISEVCPKIHRRLNADLKAITANGFRLMLQHSDIRLVLGVRYHNLNQRFEATVLAGVVYPCMLKGLTEEVQIGFRRSTSDEMLMIYTYTGLETSPDKQTITYFYA